MELSFVIAALRRNGWLVLVFALLGFFAAASLEPPRTQFQSNGLLLLSPSGFDNGVAYANQPDRFVRSQIGVLEAEGLAERVAEAVNERSNLEETAASVRRNTEITQELDSDIVVITTTTGRPERSQLIAQSYLDLYIANALETVQESSQPELDRLADDIDLVQSQLDDLNVQIQAAMAEYLPKASDETPRPIPDIAAIDPDAATRFDNLRSELKSLTLSRLALETEVASSFNSIVVQNATLPEKPIGNSTGLLTAALVFVASTLGLIIALVWTRFSKRVLDELQAAEILGMPIVGEVDHSRSLRRSPLVAFDNLPSSLIPIIDQLSVRAEAMGSVNEPLTVAIVGTQRVAGTSTLATAMAGRFSAAEFEVVLVDMDASDPYLSEAFNGTQGEGLAAVFTPNPERAFSQTGRVGVTLLGRGQKAISIRRDLVSTVLEVAKTRAHIVIVDAGSVLDAAATVELCDLVDAVVLAVPLRRQEIRPLGHVARQFEPITKKVLPVVTHPLSKRAAVSPSAQGAQTRPAPPAVESVPTVPPSAPPSEQQLPAGRAKPVAASANGSGSQHRSGGATREPGPLSQSHPVGKAGTKGKSDRSKGQPSRSGKGTSSAKKS